VKLTGHELRPGESRSSFELSPGLVDYLRKLASAFGPDRSQRVRTRAQITAAQLAPDDLRTDTAIRRIVVELTR